MDGIYSVGVQLTQTTLPPPRSSSAPTIAPILVVIDDRLTDVDTLLQGVRPDAAVLRLGHHDDIATLTQAIRQLGQPAEIHLVSHGAPGRLFLGGSELSLDTLPQWASHLAQWFSGADAPRLLLYGCNAAAGDAGAEFITKLHRLTGAAIAASTTRIGSAALGGNWTFDATVGQLPGSLAPAFVADVQQRYAGVMVSLQFLNPQVVQGTGVFNVDEGDAFRFNNVVVDPAPGTQQVDALLTVVALNNGAEIQQLDDNSRNILGLRPRIGAPNISGAAEATADFQLAFFQAGTNTPVAVDQFFVTLSDVDGESSAQEFGDFTGFQSSTRLADSGGRSSFIQLLPSPTTPGATRFTSPGAINQDEFDDPDNNIINPEVAVALNYTNTSVLNFSLGLLNNNNAADLDDRQFAVIFNEAIAGQITPPQIDPPIGGTGNTPPVAVNDTATTALNTPVIINLVGNDTDAEDPGAVPGGGITSINGVAIAVNQPITLPSGGTVTLLPGGSISYTPPAGFTGQENFTYTVADNNGLTATASANVAVGTPPVNPNDQDGDGIPDAIDLDDDNDGITDVDELQGDPSRDTDGDGIIDSFDLDADNDGILDVVEAGHDQADPDGDGRLNGPFGPNGLADVVETTPESGVINYTVVDTDGDGVRDFQDLDSDDDGILDVIEGSLLPSPQIDPNGDGIVGGVPVDSDGDGILDVVDPNSGGTPSAVPDTDSDGIRDFRDLDTDGDGLNDLTERGGNLPDANGDGRVDGPDPDGDGIRQPVDGAEGPFGTGPVPVPPPADPNGNGIPEFRELPGGPDNDGDGIPDAIDLDDDNDGIPDIDELQGDPNRDTDGDGIIDSFDLDADNDGILDVEEAGHGQADADGDGRLDGPYGPNGLADIVETTPESGTLNYTIVDTDGDGVRDFQDLDSDNDGILDVVEGSTLPANVIDPNGDGLVGGAVVTVDANGIPGTPVPPPDTDGDGTPDYRDLDTDNDGINDIIERGGDLPDANMDGRVDGPDPDGDGIVQVVDGAEGEFGTGPVPVPVPADLDGNGVPEFRELPLPGLVGGEIFDRNLSGFSDEDQRLGTDGDDLLNGGSDDDVLNGGLGRDLLNGGSGSDRLLGGAGGDLLNGGSGPDRLFGNGGNDIINGGRGADRAFGGSGDDEINGGGGRDRLFGGGGRDQISGNRGNDLILGGGGRDTLTGGQGRDVFRYRSVNGRDVITDFSIVADRIDLRALGVSGLGAVSFRQRGDDAIVRVRADGERGRLALLEDVQASTLDGDNFIFA